MVDGRQLKSHLSVVISQWFLTCVNSELHSFSHSSDTCGPNPPISIRSADKFNKPWMRKTGRRMSVFTDFGFDGMQCGKYGNIINRFIVFSLNEAPLWSIIYEAAINLYSIEYLLLKSNTEERQVTRYAIIL